MAPAPPVAPVEPEPAPEADAEPAPAPELAPPADDERPRRGRRHVGEVEVVAPKERDTTPEPPSRKGLLVVVIGLVLLAAVIAAVVFGPDDEPSSGADPSTVTTLTDPTTTAAGGPAPEATLHDCTYADGLWTATGTAQGGGQAVARYEVVVGVQEPDGTVYAEKTARVVPATDRAQPVEWSTTLALAADAVVPQSECLLLRVEALRVQPR